MAKKTIKSPEEIRQFLLEACAKKELLIIITPYLKFESNFVHFDGHEVHVKTVTGGEDALNILNVSELQLRFPNKMEHLETTTRFIGLGSFEGSKTIRFARPHSISVSDGRKSERITALENAHADLTLKDKRKVRADVADLSAEGAKLVLSVDLPHGDVETGERITASLYLPNDISFTTTAIVRHMEYKTIGIEFSSDISHSVIDSISRWAFREKEMELERMSGHADLSALAEATAAAIDQLDKAGILLVTRDDELDSELGGVLGQNWKYYRILPAGVLMNDALTRRPHLIILHIANDHFAETMLMRSLSESIPSNVPILLLGTGVNSDSLMNVGRECKAISFMLWVPNKALFLQRLVLGIMRKYYSKGESPMAPVEVEV
jgi:hypothetical protein